MQGKGTEWKFGFFFLKKIKKTKEEKKKKKKKRCVAQQRVNLTKKEGIF